MRKMAVACFAVLILTVLASSAEAAWFFERLSNNAGTSDRPKVARDGSNVHVVWRDNTYGDYEIFYKRSTDGGNSWSFQRLSNNSGDSRGPDVAMNGTHIHVVWSDSSLGSSYNIFYKRSTNNGATWSFQQLSDNSGNSLPPRVTVSGTTVHVVWHDTTFTGGGGADPTEIFYKRSTNDGAAWSWQRLTSNAGWSDDPVVAALGTTVHVVWADNTLSGGGSWDPCDILYKRSTNNGSTWTWYRLTSNAGNSIWPDVAAEGINVHLVWEDDSYGNDEIFYKRSTNSGIGWSFQRLSNNTGDSEIPAVAVSGSSVYVAWHDYSYADITEIFFKQSTDNGSSWYFERLTNNTRYSLGAAVAASGTVLDVVWYDSSLGTPPAYYPDIFYKRGPSEGPH